LFEFGFFLRCLAALPERLLHLRLQIVFCCPASFRVADWPLNPFPPRWVPFFGFPDSWGEFRASLVFHVGYGLFLQP